MQWAKQIKSNKNHFLLVILFIVLFLITRIPLDSTEAINPDAVNWHYRSQQFIVGLKSFQFEKTYQHYHPGVTLMWITGVPIEFTKQLLGINHYDINNFEIFHFTAKLSLILAQLALTLLIIYLLSGIINFKYALIIASMFSFEPFFIGNSRLYHMDILFSLFVFISLLYLHKILKFNETMTSKDRSLSFSSQKKDINFKLRDPEYSASGNKTYYTVLLGIFISLSFLTRSIGIGLIVFTFLIYVLDGVLQKKLKSNIKNFTLVFIVFVAATFMLFPALWVNPLYYIKEIFMEGERVGIRDGHSQIFLGNTTENPGFLFYPLALLLKLSPFILTGVLGYILKKAATLAADYKKIAIPKNILNRLVILSGIFYLGYFAVMSFPSKKIDRYMLVLWPFLAFMSVVGYKYLYDFFSTSKKNIRLFQSIVAFLLLVNILVPLVTMYPYYFTYTNPVFGNANGSNKIIGQKSFGIGINEVKRKIYEKYSTDDFLSKYDYRQELSAAENSGSGTDKVVPRIGMIDTKPLRSIYPNSKIFDIRVSGTGDYDLMILAVNEDIPEKVLNSGEEFIIDEIIKINNLDYWRFYVKKK